MAATVTAPVAEAVTVPRYRFSVEEFELMHENGIFNEDSPVELIRGGIVEMAAQDAAHVYCVESIHRLVKRVVGPDVMILAQSSILLPNRSMPEPDLTVAMRRGRRVLPTPPDILLVAEVADASLAYDRSVKLPLYAEAGIPEAWLFDLVAHRIERHTDPAPGGYQAVAYAAAGQGLPSTVLPELTFDAAELLGLGRR